MEEAKAGKGWLCTPGGGPCVSTPPFSLHINTYSQQKLFSFESMPDALSRPQSLSLVKMRGGMRVQETGSDANTAHKQLLVP